MPAKEIISPLNDFVFTQVFGTQQNIGNTKAFLKTLLDIPEDDYDLTVESPVLKRFFQQDKMGVVDLKLDTKSGRIIHIELQVKKHSDLKNRMLYYMVRLIGDQLRKGEKYGKLHQVISILICDHVLLEEETSYINRYELRNRQGGRFTDLLEMIILELPKLPETADSALWPWLRFFTCKRKEEYEMLTKKHPEVKEAVKCVRKTSFGERWRYTLFLMQIRRMDRQMWLDQAREEALEEGKAQGIAEGRAEGLAEGRAKGKAQGIAEGRVQGLVEGKAQGVAEGLVEGKSEGLAEGRAEGLVEGKAQGIAEGLVEGKAQGIAEGLAEGKAEGRAEGLAQGHEERTLEIARKMKSRGRPLAEISEDTGLSPEAVERL